MRPVRITGELSYYPERFRSCNVYLLRCFDRAILFDPSLSPEAIESDRPVTMVLATHAHYDHVGAVNAWKEEMPERPFLMHEGDIPMLDDPAVNASVFFGRSATFAHPDQPLTDGEVLSVHHEYDLTVIHTPGHTMGSSCFLIERKDNGTRHPVALITGDTLFDRAWGRTDFVTGDDALMRRSLEGLFQLLSKLPPELPVCPGHSGITTAFDACRFLAMSGFSQAR